MKMTNLISLFVYFIVLGSLNLIPCVQSTLTIQDASNASTTIDDIAIYSAFPWDISKEAQTLRNSENVDTILDILLIRLDTKKDQFDPCDEASFTDENVQSLLDSAEEEANDAVTAEIGWIALVSDSVVSSQCNGLQPVYASYPAYILNAIQHLTGVKGIILSVQGQSQLTRGINPPGLNIPKKTIHGKSIVIPVVATKPSDGSADLTNTETHWIVKKFAVTPNPLEDLFNPFGFYGIFCMIVSLSAISVAGYTAVVSRNKVWDYYKDKKDHASRMALLTRVLILGSVFCGSIIRCFAQIDPLGVYSRYNFFTARILLNLAVSVATFTDIITVFYCWDVYKVFKSSRQMKKASPFLVKHKYGGFFLFSFAFFMVILDTVVVVLSLQGTLGPLGVLVGLLYTALASLAVTIALFVMSCLMKAEVDKVLKKSKDKSAAVSGSRVSSVNAVKVAKREEKNTEKVKTFLRMRSYFICSACCRAVTIYSYGLIGNLVNEVSVSSYTIAFALAVAPAIISAIAQVQAASALPTSFTLSDNANSSASSRVMSTMKRSVADAAISKKENKGPKDGSVSLVAEESSAVSGSARNDK